MMRIKRIGVLLGLVFLSSSLLAQVEVTLTKQFIDKYADRVTIDTHFRVDVSSRIHPAKEDGDIHIAGTAPEIGLPAVAEIMNAKDEATQAVKTVKDAETGAGDHEVDISGAWRIWPEHGGEAEQQGETVPILDSSGVAHVFEIHPATSIGTEKVSTTWKPISGYTYKDAEQAFNAYERTHSHVTVAGQKVTISMDIATYNYPHFLAQLLSDPKPIPGGDGMYAYVKIFSLDRDLLVTKRRAVFAADTPPAALLGAKHQGDWIDVVGIPRVSLKLLKWRIENFNKSTWKSKRPLDWNLPYELVIAAMIDANPPD
jgi:hypothetical protein